MALVCREPTDPKRGFDAGPDGALREVVEGRHILFHLASFRYRQRDKNSPTYYLEATSLPVIDRRNAAVERR